MIHLSAWPGPAAGTSPEPAARDVFEPDEQLTGEEALLAYTLWPALARGYTDRGHLSVGAVGDVTLFDVDPVTAAAESLQTISVLLTVVDGTIVHRADTL